MMTVRLQGVFKIYQTGDFFGESALMQKGTLRTATVTALTVCRPGEKRASLFHPDAHVLPPMPL
jgi:hypothetical protein